MPTFWASNGSGPLDGWHAINPLTNFIGLINPTHKACDFFCFVVTDVQCSFVEPVGFMDCDTYRSVAVQVKEGELIPGTGTRQRFGTSFFLPRPAPVIPFVRFLMRLREAAKAGRSVIGAAA